MNRRCVERAPIGKSLTTRSEVLIVPMDDLHLKCCLRPSIRKLTKACCVSQSKSIFSIIQPENVNMGRREGVVDMSDPSEFLIRTNQSSTEGYFCRNPSLFISQPVKEPEIHLLFSPASGVS